MNERIRELVEKSYIYDKQNDSSFFNKEKFARLIVRECASIASGTAVENPPNDLFYGYNLGVNKTAEKIREHFGVEE